MKSVGYQIFANWRLPSRYSDKLDKLLFKLLNGHSSTQNH